MGGVRPLAIIEIYPAADPGLGLRAGFPSVQINAFILQRPPEPFDEDIVDAAALAATRHLFYLLRARKKSAVMLSCLSFTASSDEGNERAQ